MNTLKPRRLKRSHWLLLGLLLAGAAWPCRLQTPATAQVVKRPIFNIDLAFSVRNYGGKCLDFGPAPHTSGAPVFIYDCNGTAAQLVKPVEIDPSPASRHVVVLYAGNDKVIGVKGSALIQQAPLELQDYNGSAGQIFELDGDSIILAADRQLVVEVLHARGANYTPLVLGNRDLADAEFWDFKASDGSNRGPTRGFVRISQVDDFDNGGELRARLAFLDALGNAHAGTIIELDANVSINLTDVPPLMIPAGVTIRGDRRGARPGPELRTARVINVAGKDPLMLEIAGESVRLTGLRMRGPTRSLDGGTPSALGVLAHNRFTAIIDHNEFSDWPLAAIKVDGVDAGGQDEVGHPEPRPESVRVARNFIHHNRKDEKGYGVVVGHSGYVSIEGNTFVENRHAIAGDGREFTGYRAWFNLVLNAGPDYGNGIIQQDFDMHGRGNYPCQYCGGVAGEYIEIAANTFLGHRVNFDLRGTPTQMAEFHDNVLVGAKTYTIVNRGNPDKLDVRDNQFLAPNPTKRLGVGDFDGDGAQDLFLATGAAWYYAPAGRAEWRFLNTQADKIDTLLFGDFDADGRTDVFTQHDGSRWDVSWGAASRWETINGSGPLLGQAAIGDFDGDRRADVFYTDGREWLVSFGGTGFFTHYAYAIHRVSDLRFGDFNNDGKTDVFGVVGDQWMVVFGGTQFWAPLRPKLTNSVEGLTVADFNGDGRADVGASGRWIIGGYIWKVSFSGTDNWVTLRTSSVALASAAAVGRFDGDTSADVLLWNDNHLDRVAGGAGTALRHSREDMR